MNVTGGVMVWVLYAPEDGSAPQSVDAWLPFQMKWDFPETQRDGAIRVYPYLKGMDCRSLSARKMMIRSGVTILGEAIEPVDVDLWYPENVPEDVQLLRQKYPMELPQEAGEKPFMLEEEMVFPANLPPVAKIIRCEIQPGVLEKKVLAGKLVFRGICAVHLLYASDEGEVYSWDLEIPFSQLADLDRDYSPSASADVHMIVTGFEQDRDPEGKLLLKCGLSAQYMITDRSVIEVIEDAYSNLRTVKQHQQFLNLPVRLDVRIDEIPVEQNMNANPQNVLDIAAYWDCPVLRQSADSAEAELDGHFQILYKNETESLQSASVQKQVNWSLESDSDNYVCMVLSTQMPKTGIGPEGMQISMNLSLETAVFSRQGIPMITALELGEITEPDPLRPSLILRKAEGSTLWELAKSCGSTVEAICSANELEQEPIADRMLLIPVL